jgi:hypothetical protein
LTETPTNSRYSIQVLYLMFLCFFLVWAGTSLYFLSQHTGSSNDEQCWGMKSYQYQETVNGIVVYQHEFCELSFITFAVLLPFKIISTESLTGSSNIAPAHILGWIALGLWAFLLLWTGCYFKRNTTLENEYEAAHLMDFTLTLLKIVGKSVIAAVLFLCGSIWFEGIIQEALNGFAGMGLTDMFNASSGPNGYLIMFLFTVFFFSIPFIICLIIIFFLFRSIRYKTVVLR